MHRLLVVVALGGCGGSSRPPVAPAPVTTAETVAMTDPCDGGEIQEDPCAGGEAKEQVAIADPCDGGEVQGGLGLRGTGEGGGGTGDGLGSIGTIGSGNGTGSGSGYGAGGSGSRPAPRPPTLTFRALVVTGKLAPDVVRRVFRARTNAFRFCYEKELQVRPDAKGRVELELVISPEGKVVQAKATGVGEVLEACLGAQLLRIQFPKPARGIVKVTHELTFSPGS